MTRYQPPVDALELLQAVQLVARAGRHVHPRQLWDQIPEDQAAEVARNLDRAISYLQKVAGTPPDLVPTIDPKFRPDPKLNAWLDAQRRPWDHDYREEP